MSVFTHKVFSLARSAAVMALLALPAFAESKATIVTDFTAMHSACLAYLGGDANAIAALSTKGFEVRQRGKKTTAIKRGPVGVPANRRPEASITVGKKIPMGAQATCQLNVSRIDESTAQVLNAIGIATVQAMGFKPRGGNGIMMEKYDRGAETWVISGSFETGMGMLNQIVSKMK